MRKTFPSFDKTNFNNENRQPNKQKNPLYPMKEQRGMLYVSFYKVFTPSKRQSMQELHKTPEERHKSWYSPLHRVPEQYR